MSDDLTPKLRDRLADVAAVGAKHFSLRQKYDRDALADYQALARKGYCSEHETGPGGSALAFRITDKGRAALGK